MKCNKVVAVKLGSTIAIGLLSYFLNKDKPDTGTKVARNILDFAKEIELVESIVECAICGKKKFECHCLD